MEKLARLRHYLGGIQDMRYLPGVFIVDTTKEELAIKEAKLGIKIIGLVDTNGDPSDLDFPIPEWRRHSRNKVDLLVFANVVIKVPVSVAAEQDASVEENIQIAKERYDELLHQKINWELIMAILHH